MVGVLVVVLGSSPFVAVDGGLVAQSHLLVPHRTIEVFAPSSALQSIVVSDGDAPQTHLRLSIEAAPAPRLDDAGVVFYNDAQLSIAEPLTLRIKRSGSLTIELAEPFSRQDGNKHFIDRPRASFALIPSAPFEDLGAGRLRVVAPSASIDVQLQVSGPPVPWPVFSGPQSWGASMVWDAARGRLVRFGGSDAFDLETATFIWDPLTGWQALPIESPPPRSRASLVYDSVRQRVVLFGGLTESGWLGDTWEFDGSQWVEVTPPISPPPRWGHGAAFDETSGSMILFGGLAGPSQSHNVLGDTWRWDGTTWTFLQPPSSPSARDAFGMTWDGTRRRITLVAGWDGQNVLSDAWTWTGNDWQPLPALPAVAARSSTALAWSPVTGELVLAGGWLVPAPGASSYFADTWRFDGTVWGPGPSLPRVVARVALVGHPTLGVLMLGGRDNRIYNSDFAMLEPTWRRLTQGDRTERGPVMVSRFAVVGERYLWTREPDAWVALQRLPEKLQVVATTVTTIFAVIDGGIQAVGLVPTPPPFQLTGDLANNLPWVADVDGGLHAWDGQEWAFVARVPPGLRALTQRSGSEFLAWTDRLHIWTPVDGGLRTFGNPLAVDGGIVVSNTQWTAIATEARGSWHLSTAGVWVYAGLPILAERVGSTLVSGGGLARYDYFKAPGARCDSDSDCLSQSCVDSRCCDRPCAEACEVCSVAAGALTDGVCRTAPFGLVCLETGCGNSICDGFRSTCPAFAPCVDAGMEPEPRPDAGRPRRDAGTAVVEPEPPPPGCGCFGSPGAAWCFVALWVLKHAPRPRARSCSRNQRFATKGRGMTPSS